VSRLSDASLERLRQAADRPDLSSTRYEILGELGRGGMGTVYRARDRELDREVALKVLTLDDESTEVRERMLSEARILASLDHPGIIPVHDVSTLPDGRTFYAMKLVRGERLDEHGLSLPTEVERLRVFERVCETVAFAHAQGVVHRDLKPANVMVGAFGEVLVLDWGVATRGSPSDGGKRVVVGTPGYMAPEQADAHCSDGVRADIHALGAILAFLLTEEPPPIRYDSDRIPSIERRLAERSIAAPLRAICRKAIQTEPERRYGRVVDLASDVASYLGGLPVTAHRESVVDRLGRIVQKYKTPILLVLAYLLMRVVLFLFGSA